MQTRRKSRELALQALYSYEITADGDIERAIAAIATTMEYESQCSEYAQTLVESVLLDQSEIDTLVQRHAANWELRRMAATDRNILRIAVAELKANEVPYKVVIDEAVEIAKLYGTDESGKFVNGILDSIRKELVT